MSWPLLTPHDPERWREISSSMHSVPDTLLAAAAIADEGTGRNWYAACILPTGHLYRWYSPGYVSIQSLVTGEIVYGTQPRPDPLSEWIDRELGVYHRAPLLLRASTNIGNYLTRRSRILARSAIQRDSIDSSIGVKNAVFKDDIGAMMTVTVTPYNQTSLVRVSYNSKVIPNTLAGVSYSTMWNTRPLKFEQVASSYAFTIAVLLIVAAIVWEIKRRQ